MDDKKNEECGMYMLNDNFEMFYSDPIHELSTKTKRTTDTSSAKYAGVFSWIITLQEMEHVWWYMKHKAIREMTSYLSTLPSEFKSQAAVFAGQLYRILGLDFTKKLEEFHDFVQASSFDKSSIYHKSRDAHHCRSQQN